VVLKKDGEDQLDLSCEKSTVKKEINVPQTIKRRKANWTGHILRRNCHLKHVIEGRNDGSDRKTRTKT
jgi:hypothetical protein